MALKGGITYVSNDEIYGWARLSHDPYRPPIVQATLDGVVLAEGRADMLHEPFATLGEAVAACAFMLDISSLDSKLPLTLMILVDGQLLPQGIVKIQPRPSEDEIHVGKSSAAHILVYRRDDFEVTCNEPLQSAWLYSKSRQPLIDRRRLGFLIGSIYLDDMELDMNDVLVFSQGFYVVETGPSHLVRWTNGKAMLKFRENALPKSVKFKVYALAPGT